MFKHLKVSCGVKRFILLIFVIFSLNAFSQEKIIDAFVGYSANSYKGDFSTYGKYRNALNLGLVLNRNKTLGGELNLRIGTIVAESNDFSSPIVPFVKTNYFSLNYGLNIRFLTIKDKLSFHFVPGFGIIRFSSTDFDGNKLESLNDTRDKGEEISPIAVVLPMKLQFRYRLTDKVGLFFESGFLNTRTDYLDNISQLSNSSTKDNIIFLNFNVSFLLKKGEKALTPDKE